ncbi:MAG TPA: hypothetical protein VGL70_23585 [Candidatus Binatia bacterium]|jgi:hypothetical protein
MLRRSMSIWAAAIIVSLSLAGSVLAEELKGKITKVGDDGREITVAGPGGKEVKVSISGSRTKIEGVGGRGDLKAGQNVTVDHDGGQAKTIKVTK